MTLRDVLRAETADLHQAIDSSLSRFDLTALGDYGRFLAIQAAALIPIEAALDEAGAADAIPDWADRRRSDVLLSDLDRLGIACEAVPVPYIQSTAEMFGAAYVLEGSRLGGTLLLRQARESDDPRVLDAMAFLSHGQGRKFWPSFVAALEGAAPAPQQDVVDGARRAFSAFRVAVDRAAG